LLFQNFRFNSMLNTKRWVKIDKSHTIFHKSNKTNNSIGETKPISRLVMNNEKKMN